MKDDSSKNYLAVYSLMWIHEFLITFEQLGEISNAERLPEEHICWFQKHVLDCEGLYWVLTSIYRSQFSPAGLNPFPLQYPTLQNSFFLKNHFKIIISSEKIDHTSSWKATAILTRKAWQHKKSSCLPHSSVTIKHGTWLAESMTLLFSKFGTNQK